MKKRILFMSFLITALALLVFSFVSTAVYHGHTTAHAEEHLSGYFVAYDEEKPMTEEYAVELATALDARVTFFRLDGIILADSAGASGDRSQEAEVQAAMQTGEGFYVRYSQTLNGDTAYLCRAYENGLVRIAIRATSYWEIYAAGLPASLGLLAADLLLCVLFTYLATGYMLRPVEELAKAASKNQRISTECKELFPIVRLMNYTKENADKRLSELNEEKELTLKAQASKNEFIANITHEMNTPLTSIKGFAELLASGNLPSEQAQRAAQTILSQSERLTSLVASIINYNQIDSENLPEYEVDATRIARELLETLAPFASEQKVTLSSQIEGGVMIESRHERITEIFGNLIRNAIRYNRAGGSVTVTLTQEKFVVADTGIGIAEENLQRIFDRFFTVDKSHGGKNGGFGLGLAIVKKLCKKAGWQLSVESKLGEGTTFTIAFSPL